jgi:hypothetical protein
MTPKKASKGTGATARTTVSKNHFQNVVYVVKGILQANDRQRQLVFSNRKKEGRSG